MKIDHFSQLKKAVQEFQDKNPYISSDNAFVAWFLRAFIVGTDEEAINALKGGARDKGIDAVYIDHASKSVFIIQGKYHQGPVASTDKRSDVIALGLLGRALLLEDKSTFDMTLKDAEATVQDILKQARRAIQRDGYRLVLQFVTTGKVSDTHKAEAQQLVEDWKKASFEVCSRAELIRLMQDYLEGVAPPIPNLYIPIQGEELFSRFDEHTGISSWVFSINGEEVGKIFNETGIRIFARNIRGFLGRSEINREIETTLKNEPEYFWYFNNGVTIICDGARQISERGKNYLRVDNAQIINGQQTTRVLAEVENSKLATVMVKIIVVPRETEGAHDRYSKLVNEIVRATNRQNAIQSSDLRANDTEQVRIERELRKFNYQYIRKRQTKAEARRASGMRFSFIINKEELAQRIAACLFGPYEVRLGKNRLFENDLYLKIFSGRPISEYIVYYWLGRIIFQFTSGDVRRGYAKWLVLNYLWSKMGNTFKKSIYRERFRLMAERQNKYKKQFSSFYGAINKIFIASLAFHRENKFSEKGIIIDESMFFKYSNLPNRFRTYLKKKKKQQNEISSQLSKFLTAFEKTEI